MTGEKYCLFSAPFSFLDKEKKEFNKVLPTVFREIWDVEDLEPDSDLKVWIMNPGQRFVIDDEVLEFYPNLEALITPSTGRNHIDLEACEHRRIDVYSLLDERNTLNTITASAEFTFLLLLNTLRRLDLAMAEVTSGRWRQNEDVMRGLELSGRLVGLVGLGRIGQNLANWCLAFNAKVAYYDPYVNDTRYKKMSLEEVFSESDAVCVCCTLSDETAGMIDRRLLELLKPGASLVNTSRGEVINEKDLITVLKKRPDLRVALDVLAGEVNKIHLNSPLIEMHKKGQIVVTPHIAGATVGSQTKAATGALNLMKRFYSERNYKRQPQKKE